MVANVKQCLFKAIGYGYSNSNNIVAITSIFQYLHLVCFGHLAIRLFEQVAHSMHTANASRHWVDFPHSFAEADSIDRHRPLLKLEAMMGRVTPRALLWLGQTTGRLRPMAVILTSRLACLACMSVPSYVALQHFLHASATLHYELKATRVSVCDNVADLEVPKCCKFAWTAEPLAGLDAMAIHLSRCQIILGSGL
eukprot:scaffold209783_cov21-Prasinocladus_malaysianus.AAC.3